MSTVSGAACRAGWQCAAISRNGAGYTPSTLPSSHAACLHCPSRPPDSAERLQALLPSRAVYSAWCGWHNRLLDSLSASIAPWIAPRAARNLGSPLAEPSATSGPLHCSSQACQRDCQYERWKDRAALSAGEARRRWRRRLASPPLDLVHPSPCCELTPARCAAGCVAAPT